MSALPRIAITIGDPAGIGPEIALKAVIDPAVLSCCLPLLIGPRTLFCDVGARLSLPVPDQLIDTGPAALFTPGRISAAAGAVAAAAIEEAIAGTQDGRYAALVTNPIHKQAIHAAGVPFRGTPNGWRPAAGSAAKPC